MQIFKSIKKENNIKNKKLALYGFLDSSGPLSQLLCHTHSHTHTIQALLYDHQIALPSAHSVNYTGASHKNKEQINTLKTEKESVSFVGALKGTGHNVRTVEPRLGERALEKNNYIHTLLSFYKLILKSKYAK